MLFDINIFSLLIIFIFATNFVSKIKNLVTLKKFSHESFYNINKIFRT